ncbi:Membrane protein insertase YidC [Rhodovastum atsumiense]|uniref:Membrane protein insertase YidC n=1 Tax=Rhodovastum atsumiense TaxID=504468 RepID=A0A5M6IZ38_9PROT|nr:membrane protein insertase YidC [Rhodovastum atsumiense]KAA5613097.1 membrane protein insertase YidC [Rhodovastum atsumiense]CAH2600031.1 Membrane protein insertase YidC [Rhodovastum atsumiense]
MDQKRLILAIAASVAILMVFQFLTPPPPKPVPKSAQVTTSQPAPPAGAPAGVGIQATAPAVPREVPRLRINGDRVAGSISLLGARIDDIVLRDYRQTIDKNSPLVRLLEPRSEPQPYYLQFGWTAAAGTAVKLPGNDTVWQGAGEVAPGKAATLTWDNGEGQTFEIKVSLDENYMFSVQQTVRNAGPASVTLYPWSRIRRDYTPHTEGYYILHEGLLGVLNGTLKEQTYSTVKSDGDKRGGLSFDSTGTGGWAGITDKYWLTALVPDQSLPGTTSFRHIAEGTSDRYQVDFLASNPLIIAPGADASLTSRAFVGAKEVHALAAYERQGVPLFSYAVDFGWFWFLTKPIFYAIDWLNWLFGNFGVAIIVFTTIIKGIFFPLANKSYRSMSKMKLLAPKMQELREQYKEDPPKLQNEMMKLYKAEKVNPASGCLPILVQIPVFFALYKVIFTTIEMRHAPFFGWIHDLSAVDPTNVFNLFGLLPFDPAHSISLLHLGVWPLLMGVTMYFQQKLNPPPPDPVQAKIFQWMPVIFTFMLANFPAGLVIYWTWNNLLTIGQQWLIMRQTTLDKPRLART